MTYPHPINAFDDSNGWHYAQGHEAALAEREDAMTDAEALLARLRRALTHGVVEGPVEDGSGYQVVRVAFGRRGTRDAQNYRSALQDIIDGGRSDGTSEHERT